VPGLHEHVSIGTQVQGSYVATQPVSFGQGTGSVFPPVGSDGSGPREQVSIGTQVQGS